MAGHGFPAFVGRGGPVLSGAIDMENEMLIDRARIADCSFSPVSN